MYQLVEVMPNQTCKLRCVKTNTIKYTTTKAYRVVPRKKYYNFFYERKPTRINCPLCDKPAEMIMPDIKLKDGYTISRITEKGFIVLHNGQPYFHQGKFTIKKLERCFSNKAIALMLAGDIGYDRLYYIQINNFNNLFKAL